MFHVGRTGASIAPGLINLQFEIDRLVDQGGHDMRVRT
jgi:hypothetical protein